MTSYEQDVMLLEIAAMALRTLAGCFALWLSLKLFFPKWAKRLRDVVPISRTPSKGAF